MGPPMSKQYDNLGLKFLYPESWTVVDETASEWPRSVTLQTPDSGFWVAQVHNESDPHQLTLQVLKTMKAEYEDLEAEPAIECESATHSLIGFDMQFYCLDLLVGAAVRSVSLDTSRKLSLLVMYQAEDREFERLQPVFAAMLLNLLANFEAASSAIPNSANSYSSN